MNGFIWFLIGIVIGIGIALASILIKESVNSTRGFLVIGKSDEEENQTTIGIDLGVEYADELSKKKQVILTIIKKNDDTSK